MKNYKEIVKKLTQKSKMQIITKGYQKGYICQQDNKIHASNCLYLHCGFSTKIHIQKLHEK